MEFTITREAENVFKVVTSDGRTGRLQLHQSELEPLPATKGHINTGRSLRLKLGPKSFSIIQALNIGEVVTL